MYRRVVVTKRPNRLNEPAKFVDIIVGRPTTHQSRSSLLLMNEYYLDLEIKQLSKEYDINISDFKKTSKKGLMEILMQAFNKRFIDKSNMRCEYCNKPVFNNENTRMANSVTTDHKNPLVDQHSFNWFDENNLAICCYKCNNEKGGMLYDDWMKIAVVKRKTHDFKVNRVANIHSLVNKIASNITDKINDSNTSVKKLLQIENIAKSTKVILQKLLLDDNISVDNIVEIKNDVLFLLKIELEAKHKTRSDDFFKTAKEEYNTFIKRDKRWNRIKQKYNDLTKS